MNLPQFGSLDDAQIKHIRKNCIDRIFDKDKIIQNIGDEIAGLYFIVEGAIIEEYPNGETEYHDIGALLNIAALLQKKTALTKLKAYTYVDIRVFRKDALNEELEKLDTKNKNFKGDLYKSAVVSLIKIYNCKHLKAYSPNVIN